MRIIRYSNQAMKFLERQTAANRQRIMTAINKLPFVGDIKPMNGEEGWRLRVGNFRVLYDDDGNIISIHRIKTRGDVYKGGKRR